MKIIRMVMGIPMRPEVWRVIKKSGCFYGVGPFADAPGFSVVG